MTVNLNGKFSGRHRDRTDDFYLAKILLAIYLMDSSCVVRHVTVRFYPIFGAY
jgi:hypothetical protein